MLVIGLQSTVPQGAGAELVKALAADLKINAAIGFQKALVSKWPDKSHFAIGADLGRAAHRGQPLIETHVEPPRHCIRKHPFEGHPSPDPPQRPPTRPQAKHSAS